MSDNNPGTMTRSRKTAPLTWFKVQISWGWPSVTAPILAKEACMKP